MATGKARTWNELVNAVFAAVDKSPDIKYIDMPDSIRRDYQYFTEADITKIRKAGYDKEITSLESAVGDYVHKYLQAGNYLHPQSDQP